MTHTIKRKWPHFLATLTVLSTLYGTSVPAYAVNTDVALQEIDLLSQTTGLSSTEVQSYLKQGYTIPELKIAYNLSKTGQVSLKTAIENQHKQFATATQLKDPEIRMVGTPPSLQNDQQSVTSNPNVTTTPPTPSDQINTAPYSVTLTGANISPADGSISLSETDMTLVGANGLNFTLSRSYSTTDAQVFDKSIYGYTYETYNQSRFALGAGWSWNMSSMQVSSTPGETYLHLTGSGVYRIDSALNISGYPKRDLKLTRDPSVTVNGSQSMYCVTSIKGQKQYFDRNGNLIKISDPYGNFIQFKYTYVPGYGYQLLSEITNNIQNKITLQYDGHTGITIQQGNRSVYLTKQLTHITFQNQFSSFDGDKELLVSVKDPSNRITKYGYDVHAGHWGYYGLWSNNTHGTEYYNPYALLTQVNHPTGAITEIQYEDQASLHWISSDYLTEVFRAKTIENKIMFTDNTSQSYGKTTVTYDGDIGYPTKPYLQNGVDFSASLSNGLTKTTTTYKQGEKFSPSKVDTVDLLNPLHGEHTSYKYDGSYDNTPSSVSKCYTKDSTTCSDPVVRSQTMSPSGDPLTQTDESGIQTIYAYDPTTNLLVETRKLLSANEYILTKYTRDGKGGITQETVTHESTLGSKTLKQLKYDFDTHGNIIGIHNFVDGKELITTLEYNPIAPYYGGFLTATNSLGIKDLSGNVSNIVSRYQWDTSLGTVTSNIDGRGYTSSYEYDPIGRLTQKTNPDASKIVLKYDDLNNTVERTDETGLRTLVKFDALGQKLETDVFENGSYRPISTSRMDTYGRPTATLDAKQNLTLTEYDIFGRQTKVTAPDQSITSYSYDDLNNTTTTIDADQNTFREKRDKLGHVTLQELVKSATDHPDLVTNTYDVFGNLTTVKDSKNQTTQYTYDVLNQLTSVTDPQNTKTSYSYDMSGKMTQITYADARTLGKKYDELGRLLQQTDSLGQEQSYTYDANGNLTSQKDRNGQLTTLTYNSRNQLLQKTPAATTNTTPVAFEYDPSGHRIKMTDETGVTSYTYNQLGQLDTVTFPDTKTLSYKYDVNGSVSSIQEPFGKTTTYNLDNMNRLNSVYSGSTSMTPDAQYTYKKSGAVATVKQPSGITTAYDYNEFKFVKSEIQKKADNTALNTFGYTYDLNNNQISKTENGTQSTFGYDALNRIATSTPFNESYTYDLRGNRQLQQSDKFVAPSLNSYEYDGYNQLRKVTTPDNKVITYKYNGDGLMTERTENGATTRYYYDGDQMIAEASVANGVATLTARYLRGANNQLIAREDATGKKAFYTHNGHGDVTELRDSAGTVLNSYSYDIWGKPSTTQAQLPNPFLYSGEYWDGTTSLQYLRARWYDPVQGRFINEDTYLGKFDNPISQNLYTYVLNSPLTHVDPSGNDARVLTNPDLAHDLGHTSTLTEDEMHNWWYFYWGDENVQFVQVDPSALISLDAFNEWGKSNNLAGFSDGGYKKSTYIKGDFTESTKRAREIRMTHNPYSKNDDYNIFDNNCLEKSIGLLNRGVLSFNVSAKRFLDELSFTGSIVPNVAASQFGSLFYNNAFTYGDYFNQVNAKLDYYESIHASNGGFHIYRLKVLLGIDPN